MEDALLSYVDDVRATPSVAARDEAGHLVGVALLADHATGSPEVHLMAVHPAWRGHGVGRRLVDACATLARGEGTGCCRSRRSGRRTRTPATPAPAASTSLPGSCR